MLNAYPTAIDVRRACRSGAFREPTAGQCPGYTQANTLPVSVRCASAIRSVVPWSVKREAMEILAFVPLWEMTRTSDLMLLVTTCGSFRQHDRFEHS
jgi:hypothetical protein